MRKLNWLHKIARISENAEMVRVEDLWRFREYDRMETPGFNTPEEVDLLREDIRANGIHSELILTYAQHSRTVNIGEGNHRLMIARELGIEAVPCRVIRLSSKGRLPSLGGNNEVPGVEPDQFGYVPGDLRPSDIGIPTV